MSAFNRLQIAPNKKLLTQLAIRVMTSWIPTGFSWFKPDALTNDGEMGKHIRAWGTLMGDLTSAIEKQRYNLMLATARGDGLVQIGEFLKTPRRVGESDDAYALRVQAKMMAACVTPMALAQIVNELSDGKVSSQLYEPWRDVKLRGGRGRGRRRPDTRFYRGGVVEIQRNGLVDGLDAVIQERKAHGYAVYQALIMDGKIFVNNDTKAKDLGAFGRSNAVSLSHEIGFEAVVSTEPMRAVAMELVREHDVYRDWDRTITCAEAVQIDNLSRNYALSVDMLNSASTGHPVYTVESGPLTPEAPTDIQSGAEILQEP